MKNTTRRGFMGLLAHLPLVGAMFGGRTVLWTDSGWDDAAPQSSGAIAVGSERWELIEEQDRIIRWVPVTERIPESGAYVLICAALTYANGHTESGITCGSYFYNEPNPGWRNGRGLYRDVTHWAELPAPPQP